MWQVRVSELNQNTDQVIERVRRGESAEVTDHGLPVARLVPIEGELPALDRMVAQGRAIAPSIGVGEPVPLPPMLGDPAVNSTEEIAASRDEERW